MRFSNDSIRPERALLDENTLFTKAFLFTELDIFIFDENGAFFDNVNGTGSVAFVKDYFVRFIGLGDTSGSYYVLLIFC